MKIKNKYKDKKKFNSFRVCHNKNPGFFRFGIFPGSEKHFMRE